MKIVVNLCLLFLLPFSLSTSSPPPPPHPPCLSMCALHWLSWLQISGMVAEWMTSSAKIPLRASTYIVEKYDFYCRLLISLFFQPSWIQMQGFSSVSVIWINLYLTYAGLIKTLLSRKHNNANILFCYNLYWDNLYFRRDS